MIKNIVFLLSFILFFIGCSNNKYVYNNQIIYENSKEHSLEEKKESQGINTPEKYNEISSKQEAVVDNTTAIDMNQTLIDFYNEWKNVKYKFGGNSKKGIDCSAFTQRIFNEKFEIKIPRTTKSQVKIGTKIKKSELEMGDLVFFKTGKYDRHVGIYMGNGNFMHASIKGVKFTKLDKPYYKKRYWTSRRVIN